MLTITENNNDNKNYRQPQLSAIFSIQANGLSKIHIRPEGHTGLEFSAHRLWYRAEVRGYQFLADR